MMTFKCLIDLDGVLVDFNHDVLKVLGKDISVFDNPKNRGRYWVDDILGITGQDFWNAINKNGSYKFWRNLPKTAEFDQVLNACFDVCGVENVCILTMPCLDSDSHKAKYEWICEHIPILKNQYLMGRPKSFCATPNSILIDDNDNNIKEFINHGGSGILFPQYWNALHEEYHNLKDNKNWAYDLLIKKLKAAKEKYEN